MARAEVRGIHASAVSIYVLHVSAADTVCVTCSDDMQQHAITCSNMQQSRVNATTSKCLTGLDGLNDLFTSLEGLSVGMILKLSCQPEL